METGRGIDWGGVRLASNMAGSRMGCMGVEELTGWDCTYNYILALNLLQWILI